MTRERLVFDICGGPFGTGFVLSRWLAEAKPNLNPLIKMPALLVMVCAVGAAFDNFGLFRGVVVMAAGVPAVVVSNWQSGVKP